MTDLTLLRRVADDRGLREFLAAERVEAIKYLTKAGDQVSIHRAQGRVQLVEELLAHLDKAQNLR